MKFESFTNLSSTLPPPPQPEKNSQWMEGEITEPFQKNPPVYQLELKIYAERQEKMLINNLLFLNTFPIYCRAAEYFE